jgi:Lipocalin-like domain
MKKILLGLLMLATIVSCKKDDETISCEVSVAGIAGSYKITKAVVSVSGVPDLDVTTTLFDACELAAVYQFKADKTVVYTENGISCSGNGTGAWDIASGNITVSFTTGNGTEFPNVASLTNVSGWNCNTLTLTEEPAPGQSYKYTFTKQ